MNDPIADAPSHDDGAVAPAGKDGLDDADLRLLQVLATAPSLTSVAKLVGLSQRHTRRITAQLLDRMGVTSIRAAVSVAAARGYIAEPPSSMQVRSVGPTSPVGSLARDTNPRISRDELVSPDTYLLNDLKEEECRRYED